MQRGDNNLETCFQYVAKDRDGAKLLKIKFYDKILDLIAREGTHSVGSRAAIILGSKRQLTVFENRISKA